MVGSRFIHDCLINLLTSKLVYTVHWEFSIAQALHISLVSESISRWSIAVKANLRPFKRDVLKWPIPVTARWHCADSCYYLPIESTLFIHLLPHQIPLFTTSLILLSVIHQHTEHAWNGWSFASERALLLYIVSDLDVFSRFTLWTYIETTSSKSICWSLFEMCSFCSLLITSVCPWECGVVSDCVWLCFCLQDPAATSSLEAETGTREPESVAINYKPSPLQVKIGKPLSHSSSDLTKTPYRHQCNLSICV